MSSDSVPDRDDVGTATKCRKVDPMTKTEFKAEIKKIKNAIKAIVYSEKYLTKHGKQGFSTTIDGKDYEVNPKRIQEGHQSVADAMDYLVSIFESSVNKKKRRTKTSKSKSSAIVEPYFITDDLADFIRNSNFGNPFALAILKSKMSEEDKVHWLRTDVNESNSQEFVQAIGGSDNLKKYLQRGEEDYVRDTNEEKKKKNDSKCKETVDVEPITYTDKMVKSLLKSGSAGLTKLYADNNIIPSSLLITAFGPLHMLAGKEKGEQGRFKPTEQVQELLSKKPKYTWKGTKIAYQPKNKNPESAAEEIKDYKQRTGKTALELMSVQKVDEDGKEKTVGYNRKGMTHSGSLTFFSLFRIGKHCWTPEMIEHLREFVSDEKCVFNFEILRRICYVVKLLLNNETPKSSSKKQKKSSSKKPTKKPAKKPRSVSEESDESDETPASSSKKPKSSSSSSKKPASGASSTGKPASSNRGSSAPASPTSQQKKPSTTSRTSASSKQSRVVESSESSETSEDEVPSKTTRQVSSKTSSKASSKASSKTSSD